MQKAQLARRILIGILAVAAIPAILMWKVPLRADPGSGIVPSLGTHCTIQVGGRIAQVRADGTWSVPNIPADGALVRPHGTCTESGCTYYFHYGCLEVPEDGTIADKDIADQLELLGQQVVDFAVRLP